MATDSQVPTKPETVTTEPTQNSVQIEEAKRVVKDAAESVSASREKQDSLTITALSAAVERHTAPLLRIEEQYEQTYGKDYLQQNRYGTQETGPGATIPIRQQAAMRASETSEEFGSDEWYMDVLGTTSAWEYLDHSGKESAARFMARVPEKEIENSWVQFGQLVDELTDGTYEVRELGTGQLVGGGSATALDSGINPLTGFTYGSDYDAEMMARYKQENPDRIDIRRDGTTLQFTEEQQENLRELGVDEGRLRDDTGLEVVQPDTFDQGKGDIKEEWNAADFIVEMTEEEAEKIDLILQIMEAAVELGRQQNQINQINSDKSEIDLKLMQDATESTGIPGLDTLRMENTRIFLTDESNKTNLIYEITMADFFNKIMNEASPRFEEQIVDELSLAEP